MPKYDMFSCFKYSDLLNEIQKYYGSVIGEHSEIRRKTAEKLAEKLYSQAPEKISTKSLKCVSEAIFVLESEISNKEGISEKLSYRHFQNNGGCDHTAVKSSANMIRSRLGNLDDIYGEVKKDSDKFSSDIRNEITAFYYLHGDQLFKTALGNKDMYVIAVMTAAHKFAERLETEMYDADAGCTAVAVAAETTRYLSGIKRMATKRKIKRGRVPDDRKYMFLKSIKDFSVFTNDEGGKYCEPEKLEKLRTDIRPKIAEIAEGAEFQKIMGYLDQIQINYLADLKDFRIMEDDMQEVEAHHGKNIHEHVIQVPNGIYDMTERLNKGQRLPRLPE